MAVPSTPLIVDITSPDRAGLLYSFDARNQINSPLFVRNDGNPLALRLVTPSVSGVRVYDDFDPTGFEVAVAIGDADQVPTAGTWQLTSGSDTTSALAADATALAVQNALNALPGIAVTVSSSSAGVFVVTYNALGAQTLLTSPANSLNPTSNVIVSRVVTGSGSTYEVQVVRIIGVPYALNETWTPFASAAADITTLVAGSTEVIVSDTTVSAGKCNGTYVYDVDLAWYVKDSDMTIRPYGAGLWAIYSDTDAGNYFISSAAAADPSEVTTWVVSTYGVVPLPVVTLGTTVYQVDVLTLSPRPYAGTFSVDDSDPIAYNASAAAVQTALANSTVTGNAGGPWTIVSTSAIPPANTVDVSGLTVPVGLDGVLDLNTYSMLQRFLLTTDSIINVTMEVQLRSTVPGSKPVTVLQVPVRVSRDVIDVDSLLPAPIGDYYTAAEVDTLLAALFDAEAVTNNSGNSTISFPAGQKHHTAVITVGGTTRTSIFILDVANREDGDMLILRLDNPASAAVTEEIRNATSGGTLLASPYSNDGDVFASFVFLSGAWSPTLLVQPSL